MFVQMKMLVTLPRVSVKERKALNLCVHFTIYQNELREASKPHIKKMAFQFKIKTLSLIIKNIYYLTLSIMIFIPFLYLMIAFSTLF